MPRARVCQLSRCGRRLYQQAFAHFEVEGCGYLDVLFVALNRCYLCAQGLNHRSVVGKFRAIRLLVGSFEQSQVECLRCLHQSVGIAVHSLAGAIGHHLAQRFYHGRYGDYGFGLSGNAETTLNNSCRHHGTYTIVHCHHALGIVGNERQAIAHRFETRRSTIGKQVRQVKIVRTT